MASLSQIEYAERSNASVMSGSQSRLQNYHKMPFLTPAERYTLDSKYTQQLERRYLAPVLVVLSIDALHLTPSWQLTLLSSQSCLNRRTFSTAFK